MEETALHLAAEHGHMIVCELLLDRGANVDAVDEVSSDRIVSYRIVQYSVLFIIYE